MGETATTLSEELSNHKGNLNGKSTTIIKKIPSYMWFNQVSFKLPRDPVYRKKIARKIFR